MFIDYYAILEIDENATQEEIKAAFRKQAIKWHPDRNVGRDTTIQMQRINEAYLILKDDEAKEKFDVEYQRFKAFKKQQDFQEKKHSYHQQDHQQSQSRQEETDKQESEKTEYTNYEFFDDTLKNWMNNARKQSVSLATQTIRDFKGMVAIGLKEGAKASGNALIGQIIISLVIFIFLGLAKACHS